MQIPEQRSPLLFDVDSPYPHKIRKHSTSLRQSNHSLHLQSPQRSSQKPKSSFKIPSFRHEQAQSNQQQSQYQRKIAVKMKSQHKPKKVIFYRQHSEPLQISIQHTNPQTNSGNENVKKRLTSLERYFEQTRSIQLPYRTQNRIHANQKFIEEIVDFQNALLRRKGKQKQEDATERVVRKTRLSQTRPKPLKIHQLESENVKKVKNNILIQKVIKEKINQFKEEKLRQLQNSAECSRPNYFAEKSLPVEVQIQKLNDEVENLYMEVKCLKKKKKNYSQHKKYINEFFAFLI